MLLRLMLRLKKMRIKLADNCNISKTRKNVYQRCIACGKLLPKGSIAISLTKPNPKQCINSINVWIHIKCAKKYFSKIVRNLGKKSDEVIAYQV